MSKSISVFHPFDLTPAARYHEHQKIQEKINYLGDRFRAILSDARDRNDLPPWFFKSLLAEVVRIYQFNHITVLILSIISPIPYLS